MINQRKIYAVEFTAIILLWTLVVLSPLLFTEGYEEDWQAIHTMWSECIVVGFAFLVNRFVLMPKLFFERRYLAYIFGVVALLVLLATFIIYFDGVSIIVPFMAGDDVALYHIPPEMHPYANIDNGAMHPRPQLRVIPPSISVLVVSILTMALDLGIRIASTWVISEQTQAAINRERMATQLQNLQNQVSPHFFMNTLNNIHALVDIDSERAKQTIIELSDLMSYLLYDCSHTDNIQLQKELDFIANYINLMRLRYSAQVKISFTIDGYVPAVKIPPLLFLNFIENAFKYGVDYEQESVINIHLSYTPSTIELRVLNSNHSSKVSPKRHGLGLKNSRRRLDLIYGDRYSLDIEESEKIYVVTLKIPIQ